MYGIITGMALALIPPCPESDPPARRCDTAILHDFRAGAVAHGLLHVVAWIIGEQPRKPTTQSGLRLIAELRLTVERPAQQPAGILHGEMPPVTVWPVNGSRLADLLDIPGGIFVQRGDGRALPSWSAPHRR